MTFEAPRPRASTSASKAAVLSFLLPGLGQLVLGARRRGILVALPTVAVVVVVVAGAFVLGGSKAIFWLVGQPTVLLAIVVANVAFGLYHLAAIGDAFRLGRRLAGPNPPARRRSGAVLIALVAATFAVHGLVGAVGYSAYETVTAVAQNPGSSFSIPLPSFGPTATPGVGDSPAPSPTATDVAVPAWAMDGRLNILLIGSDSGPGRWSLRTDTMIVLSVDLATNRAAMFGVPRNLVNVPLAPEDAGAFPNGRFPGLLNALYVYAMGHQSQFPGGDARGFRAVSGAIQQLVGVPLDGAIVIDLEGFVRMVNAIGGVWIDPPTRIVDLRYPLETGTGYVAINIKPGCQKMNGRVALEYARSRHQDSDYGRMGRQQTVLDAIAQQVDPLELLPKVFDLLQIARDDLWMTFQPGDIPGLAQVAEQVKGSKIQSVLFAPPTYREYLTTAEISRIGKVVQKVFNAAPAASPTPKASSTPAPTCP